MGPWFAVGQRLPDGHLDGGDDRLGVQTVQGTTKSLLTLKCISFISESNFRI